MPLERNTRSKKGRRKRAGSEPHRGNQFAERSRQGSEAFLADVGADATSLAEKAMRRRRNSCWRVKKCAAKRA
ncbi:hypothetical protein B296_00013257 [Ensete ventricosum]|uniref:Uncharacterized protein n=1 Tax=Ensete ventricosum TaxID=4639 RepID=A0A427AMD3_ENSVE|nr:hypothetical protein B296_00013257 [Ensete ventricosum]